AIYQIFLNSLAEYEDQAVGNIPILKIHDSMTTQLRGFFYKTRQSKPHEGKGARKGWFDERCSKAKSGLRVAVMSGSQGEIKQARSLYKVTLSNAKKRWEDS
ncbi:hypothetical protein NDU88_008075, partial [Pleurodeles waltl]